MLTVVLSFLLAFQPLIHAQLKSNPLVCESHQYLVKPHARKAYMHADGSFVKSSTVKAHCRSKRASYTKWIDSFQTGRPTHWPIAEEIGIEWSVGDKERVLQALCELPTELWISSQYKIYRMKKSRDGLNPATSASGILVLYDSAFSIKRNLARILAHEFAHEIFSNLDRTRSQEYRVATNWFEFVISGKKRVLSRKSGFVADDGRVSPEEDFANNLEFYLFDPKVLLKETPVAFQWIEKSFGDSFKLRKCE